MRLISLSFIVFIANSTFAQEINIVKQIDTSMVAILPAEEYVFDKLPASISIDEIQLMEELVQKAFKENNISFKGAINCDSNSLAPQYKRQYFPILENDEKLVYVNCFYDTQNRFPHWRKHAVVVFDSGGFVTLVVNLTKKKYTSFSISQPAFRKMRIIKTNIISSNL